MTNFDYAVPGEFYSRKRSGRKPTGLTYQRFDLAAEAIRFAIEDLPSAAFTGCMLEASGERFGARELRALYESPRYPLPRPISRTGK
jgi:hypothetical protein